MSKGPHIVIARSALRADDEAISLSEIASLRYFGNSPFVLRLAQDERAGHPLVVSPSNHERTENYFHLSVAPRRGMITPNDFSHILQPAPGRIDFVRVQFRAGAAILGSQQLPGANLGGNQPGLAGREAQSRPKPLPTVAPPQIRLHRSSHPRKRR